MEVLTMNDKSKKLLKEWLEFRQEELSTLTEEDKKHWIYFEEIAKKILDITPIQNLKFVKKQLEQLDHNFFDYNDYWNGKYYCLGFEDGVKLLSIILDINK